MGTSVLEVRTPPPPAKIEFLSRRDFKGLTFGASSSAFQYEGAADKDGKGESICDRFLKDKHPELVEKKALDAIKHYDKYKDDVKIMKDMGLDSYRFSISWPRVLPNGRWKKDTEEGVNPKGIDFYNNLINELLSNGIEPVATLFHWDLPQKLEDEYQGFLNTEKVVKDFEDYADLCFKKFGDRVKKWVTFNETWTYSISGYAIGMIAPGRGGDANFFMSKILPSSKINSIINSQEREGDPSQQRNPQQNSDPNQQRNPQQNSNPSQQINPQQNSDPNQQINHQQNSDPNQQTEPQQNSDPNQQTKVQQKSDPYREVYRVTHNQLLAHAAAVKLYRQKYLGEEKQNGQIGIILNSIWAEPYDKGGDGEIAAERAMDFMLGWLLKPLTSGDYPESMKGTVGERLPMFTPEQTESLIKSFDFIGINYYTSNYVSPYGREKTWTKYNVDSLAICHSVRHGETIGEQGGSPWLYSYPQGLKNLLLYIKDKYDNPIIYITENGTDEVNDKSAPFWEYLYDYKRVSYHYHHLLALKEAIAEGANVKGYFAWSLMDNLEFAAGLEHRFGLNFIHYGGNYERIPKLSAWWFKVLLQK